MRISLFSVLIELFQDWFYLIMSNYSRNMRKIVIILSPLDQYQLITSFPLKNFVDFYLPIIFEKLLRVKVDSQSVERCGKNRRRKK